MMMTTNLTDWALTRLEKLYGEKMLEVSGSAGLYHQLSEGLSELQAVPSSCSATL